MKAEPCFVVDTREQNHWDFARLAWGYGTLTTGDYSIYGLEHKICVERKSLPDLVACVGKDRKRFVRELERMQAMKSKMVVIEANLADVEAGDGVGRSSRGRYWAVLRRGLRSTGFRSSLVGIMRRPVDWLRTSCITRRR